MCIIAVKEAGYPIFSEEEIRRMFKRNPDGAGLMYRTKNGMVHIEKGFMNVADLLDYVEKYEKVLDDSDVVLHCRISTSGKTDELGTHPYPVWSRNNRISCDTVLAMAHNGVLDGCGWKGNKQINDTQVFIRDCLRKLPHNFLNNKAICNLIAKSIGTSKLAFLGEDGLHLFGDFLEPKKGYYYSNSSYVEPIYVLDRVETTKDDFYSRYEDRDDEEFNFQKSITDGDEDQEPLW